mmetsp:Transcript_14014/g.41106  ORF Transcript_14014/g.41106 Transcript_14014/m.41106 type:complete len:234 (-) Transcript_14014:2770-3471(-)
MPKSLAKRTAASSMTPREAEPRGSTKFSIMHWVNEASSRNPSSSAPSARQAAKSLTATDDRDATFSMSFTLRSPRDEGAGEMMAGCPLMSAPASSPPPRTSQWHHSWKLPKAMLPLAVSSASEKACSVAATARSTGEAPNRSRIPGRASKRSLNTEARYTAMSSWVIDPIASTSKRPKTAWAFSSRLPPQSTDKPLANSSNETWPPPSASKMRKRRSMAAVARPSVRGPPWEV